MLAEYTAQNDYLIKEFGLDIEVLLCWGQDRE